MVAALVRDEMRRILGKNTTEFVLPRNFFLKIIFIFVKIFVYFRRRRHPFCVLFEFWKSKIMVSGMLRDIYK